MLDHTPIVVDQFMGLFDRGESDSCPNDHFIDCLNVYFKDSAIARRPKFEDTAVTISDIKRVRLWNKLGEASARAFILTNAGGTPPTTAQLWDASVSLVTPLATFSNSNIDDFQIVSMFDKAYFVFQESGIGSDSRQLSIYDGTTFRKAAGSAPSTTLSAADSATAGSIAVGSHDIAFAFETPSGYITKPAASVTYNAPGNLSVDLSSVDVGPSGTVRRHIIATRAYNLDLEPQPEFFFVGTIEGNSLTTGTIDWNDLELVDSADYLYDQLEQVESGVFITKYRNRLVIGGEKDNKSWVRISKIGEPEAFDEVEGYLVIDPDAGGGVNNAIEYRGQLLIIKDPGAYSTVDNGQEPGFWEVIKLDSGVSCSPNGISSVFNTVGSTNDLFVMIDRSGFILFNGVFNRPELSWKIDSYITNNFNWTYYYKFQIVNDPTLKRLYFSVVIGAATEISHIIIGDYSLGLDPKNIRWAIWTIGSSIYSILLDRSTSGSSVFKVSTTSIIKQMTGSYTGNEETAVLCYGKSAFLTLNEGGFVIHFGAIRYRISGSGAFVTILYPLDSTMPTVMPDINLIASPAKEILRLTNVVNEKCSVLFGQMSIDTGDFLIRKFELFAKQFWVTRYNE